MRLLISGERSGPAVCNGKLRPLLLALETFLASYSMLHGAIQVLHTVQVLLFDKYPPAVVEALPLAVLGLGPVRFVDNYLFITQYIASWFTESTVFSSRRCKLSRDCNFLSDINITVETIYVRNIMQPTVPHASLFENVAPNNAL